MPKNGKHYANHRGREREREETNNNAKAGLNKDEIKTPSTQRRRQPQPVDDNMSGGNTSPSGPVASSPLRGQTVPVHVIHPHAHRRHYPHHLLDHFSGDLTHQTSASATWKDVVDAALDSSPLEPQTPAVRPESSGLHVTGTRQRAKRDDSPLESSTLRASSATKKHSEQKISKDKSLSNFRDTQQWPFFGTESRVLPSGRRVSFLRQACWGFSTNTTKEKEQNESDMHVVCPKAFREPSFGTPRRSILRGGPKVSELKQKFTSRDESPTKQPVGQNYVEKFKNETVTGLNESLHAQSGELAEASHSMQPCSAIIDSSSTKGRHPVPRAPGLRSPAAGQEARSGKTPNSPKQQRIKFNCSSARNATKCTSPSPTRRKESPPSWRATTVAERSKCNEKTKKVPKGPKIVVPKPETSPTSKPKPITETVSHKTVRPATVPPTPSKRSLGKKVQPPRTIIEKPQEDYSYPSSESIDDGSSLVLVDGEEDTSTYEEITADASDLSDRNFLIDYGDPSRFYFRNEWEARMRELGYTTKKLREKLSTTHDNDEVYRNTLDIIEEVEDVKTEMGELYDYFDHFEREEDTLLQQVQRQLNQANRYCKILHFRMERAEKHRVDDSRVKDLEEELKLSRQVAVSLHWELQAADAKQAKLEKENSLLRHRLLTAETARDALHSQVAKLQNNIDQMSLHAPSRSANADDSEGCSDSTSEMKRQIQFMDEKEIVMISRLSELQKEKDGLKDELNQYKDQYGELATVPASGANRNTDLKLRLKLAEDQAGLLARKVIELQLENDNMVKLAAEKELMAKEALKRNPSISDLQFLEDERESLRLALDEMEIENQKLAAELLRYKQAVHRQLHSNSISTDSPVDVGVVLRVPRSNDSVFDDEKQASRLHKSEDRSLSHHDTISDHTATGDRKKLRPLSLTSPLNHSQKKVPLSRTLSDLAIPLSPDATSQSLQITPTISGSVQGPKSSSIANGSRKSFCHKCKRSKKVKMIDAAIETDVERPQKLFDNTKKSIATCTTDRPRSPTRSQATSPIFTNLQSLFQPVLDVATQIRERKVSTRSMATSPIKATTPSLSSIAYSPTRPRPHNALLDEMRKQLANVRNIAESMDTVVNVEGMDAELERRGREIVDAECRKAKDGSAQSKKISKLAKSLQKYIKDMEESVADESERSEMLDGFVAGWNLHGNAEVSPNQDESSAVDTSTITVSSSTEEVFSVQTVRSLAKRLRNKPAGELGLRILEGTVLTVIGYLVLSSLPVAVIIQISFLLLVFFIL